MSESITIEMLHEDLETLKKDVAELKTLLLLEPTLKQEIIVKLKEARERMKKTYVSNDDIKKEFGV
jgi:hypothetical protein